ncbi:MAG: methylmalonyl Co-A mutase-associated GTPase MeaB [Gemmatimonadales bacterium]|nr:MAG: methylmalonyl Co-A mutase-associated GTPase MeaB [Gemmatimonadales bacterium]
MTTMPSSTESTADTRTHSGVSPDHSDTAETAANTSGAHRPPETELPPALQTLFDGIREGNRVALARAISVVENERTGFQSLLHALLAEGRQGGARLGITGPPGAGKSSLVSEIARAHREQDESVGIVAVDPTSPYSGGALLGDRIRMNDLALDPGIFIRSMASRGSLGGLATTTKEVLDVMDAFGFPRLVVETVGVGQTELEITGAADTVVVVLVPESGDGIQAMKAGLMEIADIFVVNKSDRPGADRLVKEVRTALHLRTGRVPARVPAHHGVDHAAVASKAGSDVESDASDESAEPSGPEPWVPPVVQTMAQTGDGVEELMETVERHRAWLVESGELERRRIRRTRERIRDILDREMRRRVRRELADSEGLEAALGRITSGSETPYSVAAEMLDRIVVEPEAAPLPRA